MIYEVLHDDINIDLSAKIIQHKNAVRTHLVLNNKAKVLPRRPTALLLSSLQKAKLLNILNSPNSDLILALAGGALNTCFKDLSARKEDIKPELSNSTFGIIIYGLIPYSPTAQSN